MTAARLAELIRTHQPCVVLTGAGVSTESGIPDFRSPGGLWAEFDPLDYASLDSFRRDPVRIWDFYGRRFAFLAEAEPNDAHRALARLEQLGLVAAVVTQNVDLLHERAGSRAVLEVHGSIRRAVCLACGTHEPLAGVLAQLETAPAPLCRDCGGVLKPDVVFFGELLPAGVLERATELARGARLLLVIGSSLEVHPVAGLPFETLRAGGTLAIVNRDATPLDAHADLRLDGSAGAILREVAALSG
jgi:NAD-dependent deacetylase